MQKKFVIAMIALCLCMCCLVGVTVAWLTSTPGAVTNTFTVGNIVITLDEADVTEYGVEIDGAARVTANEYKLIPGHTYVKDPTVTVKAGSEACYVFVKVENGLIDIIDATTIEAQIIAQGWTPLVDANGDKIADDGVYYKEVGALTAQGAADEKLVVFENFNIKDEAVVANYTSKQIVVTAYAVQQDQLTVEAAWNVVKPSA